jgi:hypothetical protein
MHRAIDGDTTRLRDAFDTRRNIHAVAHQVVAVDHDVADMNTDAQRQATWSLVSCIALAQLTAWTALANSIRKRQPLT